MERVDLYNTGFKKTGRSKDLTVISATVKMQDISDLNLKNIPAPLSCNQKHWFDESV